MCPNAVWRGTYGILIVKVIKLFQECVGELVKYNWERIIGGGSSDDIKCSNKKNTCERALCECDLDYAKKVISGRVNLRPKYSWV